MNKDIKLSDIKFSDIKDSPALITAIISLFIIAVLALSIFYISDIFKIKGEIEIARDEYKQNCERIVSLQKVRAQYNTLAAEKEMLDEMLPETADVYIVMQHIYDLCDEYNVEVVSMDTPVLSATYTTETSITLSISGTYNNIISFIDHFTREKAIHRVEKVNIGDFAENSVRQADIVIVALSV